MRASTKGERPGNRPQLLLAVALATLIGAGCGAPASNIPTSTASAVATAKAPATPSPAPTLPTTVDGLAVMTVSHLLAEREAGRAPGGPYALRGFWSRAPRMSFSCLPPPDGSEPGELELRCTKNQWAITERNESLLVTWRTGLGETRGHYPEGPYLQPWIPSEADNELLRTVRQQWTPVPIVVVGHFDDDLAAECRPSVRDECLDRFVLDRIVAFDPTSVPDPTPAPVATPFPVADPPPAPFAEERCWPGVDKSFVGWARLRDMNVKLGRFWDPDSFVYAMVTRDLVTIGGGPDVDSADAWTVTVEVPGAGYPGERVRWWGRAACVSERRDDQTGTWVLGSTFLEVDYGDRIGRIDMPFPFPG